MAKHAPASRRERILDAAEHAFAQAGFAGASLREIVLQAGVNLATVYYYFESKEGLMAAVFTRRFEPLRQETLRLLQGFQQEAGDQPVAVEKILEAMLLPSLQLAARASAKSRAATRAIGRIVTEPHPRTQELLRRQFEDVRRAILEAFQRTLPHLPMLDLRWRIEFVWGALAFILCNPGKIEKSTGGLCNPADTVTVLRQMIRLYAAGFRAPAMPSSPS
jgi:AcrR family transcriptional regulator